MKRPIVLFSSILLVVLHSGVMKKSVGITRWILPFPIFVSVFTTIFFYGRVQIIVEVVSDAYSVLVSQCL